MHRSTLDAVVARLLAVTLITMLFVAGAAFGHAPAADDCPSGGQTLGVAAGPLRPAPESAAAASRPSTYPPGLRNPREFNGGPIGPSGGRLDMGSLGSVIVPAGALLTSTDMSATAGMLGTPHKATDGGTVYEAAMFEPDGLIFEHPSTIYYAYPPGLRNPRAYLWDPDNDQWNAIASSVSGNQVVFDAPHFSWYGVGGDSVPPAYYNSPASSNWSIALLAVAALGIAGVTVRRHRLT